MSVFLQVRACVWCVGGCGFPPAPKGEQGDCRRAGACPARVDLPCRPPSPTDPSTHPPFPPFSPPSLSARPPSLPAHPPRGLLQGAAATFRAFDSQGSGRISVDFSQFVYAASNCM